MLCKIIQCAGHTLANARQHIIIRSYMNKIESGGCLINTTGYEHNDSSCSCSLKSTQTFRIITPCKFPNMCMHMQALKASEKILASMHKIRQKKC